MPELSMHLKKLETLPGALDIIRYLDESETGYADADDITYDLDMSSRRFGKATRRLVTNGYIQMRSDYVYELTRRGGRAALCGCPGAAAGGTDAAAAGSGAAGCAA